MAEMIQYVKLLDSEIVNTRVIALDRVIADYVRCNNMITGTNLAGLLTEAKKIEQYLINGEVPAPTS